MLGVVSEQFPKGGALALNFTGAVGQVGVGVIGAVILGFVQDKEFDKNLYQHHTEIHSSYVNKENQDYLVPIKYLMQINFRVQIQ